MAQLMEYAEYLSKEIGPRPAGTEEEQQAALFITECFQKDSGFSSQIEEFTTTSNIEGVSAIPGAIVIVAAILGMIFPVLAIPAFILAAASAALYSLEAFGHPLVTRALARGASQNVVAKYQPNFEAEKTARGRSRKIVLVAHYDSGKVTPSLVRTVEATKLPVPIGLVCVGGIILAAFFLLLHVFINTGVPGIIVNVLTVITLIVCAYPVLRAILMRIAPYNEGANNNASGTAALIEVARRISRGSVSEADLAGELGADVMIHGEAAARESGLVPEGAQIRYEAEQLIPPSELGEYDEEERLLAAKAAIAAMTGQPVERRTYGSVAENLVNSRAHGESPESAVAETAAAEGEDASAAFEAQPAPVRAESAAEIVQPAPAPLPVEEPAAAPAPEPSEAEGFKNAPSWFVSAQQNAKKSEGETGPIQRSRYAEAIEAAEREAAEREREAAEQERLKREAELRERERAAREAIEQSARAAEQDAAQVEQQQQQQQQQQAETAPVEEAPTFVPYSEAVAVEASPVEGGPADDEFAASLGSTMMFDPHQLQEREEASHQVPAEEAAKAEAADSAQAALDRLAALPTLDGGAPAPAADQMAPAAGVPETTSPSRSGMIRKLRTDVPSMSGVIRMQEAGQDVSQLPVRPEHQMVRASDVAQVVPAPRARAAAPAPATRADEVDYDMSYADFQDVAGVDRGYDDRRDERYDDRYDDRYDRYDRDDQRYEDAEPVEVPKSRAGGFLGRFRRKKSEKLEQSPQEWLDVDDDFDARTVGRERGGWESFREDAYDDYERETPHSRKWEGGAYSRVRLGRVDTRSGEDTEADVPSEIVELEDDRQIADEIEQIYHFRNPLYNTEVWFVALGSDGPLHDGAKAFLAEHADDLRGSMIIEIESLGLGELAVASAEGRVKRQVASSRAKRYTRSATAATGIAPGSVDLTGADSATTVFQAAGYQAMHLLGVENDQPALKGSADDVLENIDDLLLDDNVNFLMELLKK